MDKTKTKILLAEGERDLAAAVGASLVNFGYEVDYAQDGVLAITAFNEKRYDLLILGGDVSRVPAKEVAEIFSAANDAPVLCIIKNRIKNYDPLKENFGYDAFLSLPFDTEALRSEVSRALESKHLEDFKVDEVTVSYKKAKLIFGDNSQNLSLIEADILKEIADNRPIDGDMLGIFSAVTAINEKLMLLEAKIYIKKTTKGYEIAYD